MKERTMYILCLSVVVGFCTFKAFAASYHEPIQVESPTINVDADSELQAQQYEEPVNVEEVNETNEDVGYFPGCDDDEKVIPLGDGFLGGEAYLQNGDEEIYLNSETDSSAITVKEAKEILKSRQAESDNQ